MFGFLISHFVCIAGHFGVDKAVVARAAYEAAMMFDTRRDQRHVQSVHFVNCDEPTTAVFMAVFESLQDSLTAGVADRDQSRMNEDEKYDGSSQRVPRNQKISSSNDEAHSQLQPADVDKHQSAVNMSIDLNTAVQSASSVSASHSFAATANKAVVPPKSSDSYKTITSSGIDIQIYCGNLVDEKVDAIVNPANIQLIHGGGAARAIAVAAGRQLQEECRAYINQYKELKVTQPMHTTAGKMNPPVVYVIHVVGPSATQFSNHSDLYKAVFETFHHCLLYANNFLQVSSLSIPAISSGEYSGIFLLEIFYNRGVLLLSFFV